MSGPIVRKYGFPNFDEIFGKRELEHGVDDKETPKVPDSKSSEPGKGDSKTSDPKVKKS